MKGNSSWAFSLWRCHQQSRIFSTHTPSSRSIAISAMSLSMSAKDGWMLYWSRMHLAHSARRNTRVESLRHRIQPLWYRARDHIHVASIAISTMWPLRRVEEINILAELLDQFRS